MGRPTGDHDARRRELAIAVWRVLAARGFAGLSLRGVAVELGATTGAITHYFASKRELVGYALGLLEDRTRQRARTPAAAGLPAVRAAVLDMLPLDGASTDVNRVWISSWDIALADPGFAAEHAARYEAGRQRLTTLVEAAHQLGHLDAVGGGGAGAVAADLHCLALGIIVQAVLDPSAFPPGRQVDLVDGHLARLGHHLLHPGDPSPGN